MLLDHNGKPIGEQVPSVDFMLMKRMLDVARKRLPFFGSAERDIQKAIKEVQGFRYQEPEGERVTIKWGIRA